MPNDLKKKREREREKVRLIEYSERHCARRRRKIQITSQVETKTINDTSVVILFLLPFLFSIVRSATVVRFCCYYYP